MQPVICPFFPTPQPWPTGFRPDSKPSPPREVDTRALLGLINRQRAHD
jgi:hypothetical protein